MLARRRIRSQLYYGVTVLFIVIVIISLSGFWGVLSFRKLTKNIRGRASELPLAAQLSYEISDLRVAFSKSEAPCDIQASVSELLVDKQVVEVSFAWELQQSLDALTSYQAKLRDSLVSDPRIADLTRETETVDLIEDRLHRIRQLSHDDRWLYEPGLRTELSEQLESLQMEAAQLPGFLKERMDAFSENARSEYHAWMVLNALLTVAGATIILLLARRFNHRIFQPLETLVDGSRRVGAGDYDYRVCLKTNDEMSELADAFNATTRNFQAIRQDLNQQVQQRTREVVRSEQMASVGFLAAGVAHEINNPLAAIAWSAESLEMRLHEILDLSGQGTTEQHDEEVEEMRTYLRRIQDEAFRCKGITGGLLDYSRLGDETRSVCELGEIIQSVIDMVSPLGKYRHKRVTFQHSQRVFAEVKSQEMKQVILNLITNALDSVDTDGTVQVSLESRQDQAVITVIDDGCGMDEEVLRHLFEPFFTRRQDGQGTGLGLAITYRIIHEHGGEILPFSAGVGAGSSMTVTIPLVNHEETQSIAA